MYESVCCYFEYKLMACATKMWPSLAEFFRIEAIVRFLNAGGFLTNKWLRLEFKVFVCIHLLWSINCYTILEFLTALVSRLKSSEM
jgi:hypothetical protein